MPPKPVGRDFSARHGRFSSLSEPDKPLMSPPPMPPVDVPPDTPTRASNTVKNVYKAYMTSLPNDVRAQSLYTVFSDLAAELEDTEHFSEVMQRITDNLFEMGFQPEVLTMPLTLPCTLNHDPVTVTVTKEVIREIPVPCTLNHDPVTITVSKEVHPASCVTEMKSLQKEISDLKSGINVLYRSANPTHTAETLISSFPSPSPDSSHESTYDSSGSSYGSIYDNTDIASSISSTPKVASKPLPNPLPPKSYASAAKTKTDSTKSPKEIARNKTAKSCTNRGTPSNVLVLSNFTSANTAGSYKQIAEMRKKVNDILVDNKCKSISWSARGNLVTKCAKPLSDRDATVITNSAKTVFENNPTVLNKPTVSYVKFIDVPLYDIEGTPFDINDFNVMIQQSNKWADVHVTHGPHIVLKKENNSLDKNAKKATIKVGFADDKKSTMARKILQTTILFGGVPRRCKPWTSVPPAASRQHAPHASASPLDTEVSSSA